jgi:hypothetical protein
MRSGVLSAPRFTVHDRQRSQFMMAAREWVSLLDSGPEDANQIADPCQTAQPKAGSALKFEVWCTGCDEGKVATSVTWGIAGQLPQPSGPPTFPLAKPPIARHRTAVAQLTGPGEWAVVPAKAGEGRYFVMWQIAAANRPTTSDQ